VGDDFLPDIEHLLSSTNRLSFVSFFSIIIIIFIDRLFNISWVGITELGNLGVWSGRMDQQRADGSEWTGWRRLYFCVFYV
jgi:hypothetical protein